MKKGDDKQQPPVKSGSIIGGVQQRGNTFNKPVDLEEVDLEYDDGNAKQSSPAKQQPAPAAKGGVAGIALQDRINKQIEEKKRQTAAFEADRLRQQQMQQAASQKRQQASEDEEEVDEDDEEVEEEEQSSRGPGNNGKNNHHDSEEDYKPQIA